MVDAGHSGPDDVFDDRICIRNLLDGADEIIYFKDLQSRFLRVSSGYARLHGRSGPREIVGLTDFDLFDAVHAQGAYDDEQRIIATGVPLIGQVERETWRLRADSWVSSSKYPLLDAEGTIIGTFGVSRDITDRVHAEQALERVAFEREAANAELVRVSGELAAVLAASPDAISRYGPDLRYRYVNPGYERLWCRTADDVRGRTDRELGADEAFLERWEPALRRVLDAGAEVQLELEIDENDPAGCWLHAVLTPERDTAGATTGVLASVRDVTAMKRAERELAHRAMHDEVTGLPNRRLFMDRLRQSLLRLHRRPGALAVLFVDLDRFKQVNDEFGHDQGDAVLVAVADRLRHVARTGDTVARLGGDEFVVLCEDVRPGVGGEVAARVQRALTAPYPIDGATAEIGASVGVAIADDAATDPSALLRSADAAMYRVKQSGGNGVCVAEAVLEAVGTAT